MRAGAEPWRDENHEGCEKRGPRLARKQILLVEGEVRRLEGLDIRVTEHLHVRCCLS